jgi:high-affinity nickel-transport protein
MTLPLNLALLSAAVLGFRHGFDYDHIAAISDITSVQKLPARAMRLGLLYALGHAATVAVLGSLVIFFHLSLPHGIDRFAELLVGITLIVLGVYVLRCVVLRRHGHFGQSRILLLMAGARWLRWKVRRWRDPELARPASFAWNYDRKSVFTVGVIHGLGAETPSQLFVFLLAANLGGTGKGVLGLVAFLAGLLLMNTLMTASAAGLFRFGSGAPRLHGVLMGLTAAYSVVIGIVFVLGGTSLLPALAGGS